MQQTVALVYGNNKLLELVNKGIPLTIATKMPSDKFNEVDGILGILI